LVGSGKLFSLDSWFKFGNENKFSIFDGQKLKIRNIYFDGLCMTNSRVSVFGFFSYLLFSVVAVLVFSFVALFGFGVKHGLW